MGPLMNRIWTVTQQPNGAPDRDRDLKLSHSPLPKLKKDGEFLVRCTELSLDPYIRGTMNKVSYGQRLAYPRKMTCGCVAQVVESRNPSFPVGALVNGTFGWCDFAVSSGVGVRIVPNDWKRTWALGVLGMPGATAYFGLKEIIDPQPGETIAVSSCTGAVGMLVGQIAKLMGCKTIGFTSSGKVAAARDFGYDHVITYTDKDVKTLVKEIRAVAPGRINGYFDNAGGVCTEAVMSCLAMNARVSVCGQIAYYNLEDPLSARAFPGTMTALTTQSKIEGFIVSFLPKRAPGDWSEAFDRMSGWLRSGELKVLEDTTEGLENAFEAFTTLFHGVGANKINLGKKIVKIADPPLPLLVAAKL